jgi:hypothetical protein
VERERVVRRKVAACTFARGYLSGIVGSVFNSLQQTGFFYDPVRGSELWLLPLDLVECVVYLYEGTIHIEDMHKKKHAAESTCALQCHASNKACTSLKYSSESTRKESMHTSHSSMAQRTQGKKACTLLMAHCLREHMERKCAHFSQLNGSGNAWKGSVHISHGSLSQRIHGKKVCTILVAHWLRECPERKHAHFSQLTGSDHAWKESMHTSHGSLALMPAGAPGCGGELHAVAARGGRAPPVRGRGCSPGERLVPGTLMVKIYLIDIDIDIISNAIEYWGNQLIKHSRRVGQSATAEVNEECGK